MLTWLGARHRVPVHVFEDDWSRLRVTIDRTAVERKGGKGEEVLRLANDPLLVHVTVAAKNRNGNREQHALHCYIVER